MKAWSELKKNKIKKCFTLTPQVWKFWPDTAHSEQGGWFMIFMIIVLLNVSVCTGVPIVFSAGVKLSVLHAIAWQFPALVIAGQLWNAGQTDPVSRIHLLHNNSSFSMCTPILCHAYIYSYTECLLNIYLQVEQFVLEGREQPGQHGLVQQSELNSARNGQSSRLNVLLNIMTTGCKDSPLF